MVVVKARKSVSAVFFFLLATRRTSCKLGHSFYARTHFRRQSACKLCCFIGRARLARLEVWLRRMRASAKLQGGSGGWC